MDHPEKPMHVDWVKEVAPTSVDLGQKSTNSDVRIPNKSSNFSYPTMNNKSYETTINTSSANDKQSSLNITKILEDQECDLKKIPKSLTSYNSTPNLVDTSDDEADNDEKSNQRDSLLFRNKSSDCLTSLLPYFEINLLNICHEYDENDDRSLGEVPKAPLRKKKFKKLDDIYNYLNSDNTFTIKLKKGSRGLGLAIFGGVESSKKDLFSQLIRIKKLYPLQPAMESGKLFIGDVILQVNNMKMVGLTNTEALEIMRCVSADVTLEVFRPSSCNFPSFSTCRDVLPIFLDSPPSSTSSSLSGKFPEKNCAKDLGEFKITLLKKDGSLGFTVSHNEGLVGSQPAGIYVKALIREPAISDGRIHPGDGILQVNGTDVSQLTHTEAVTFLRNASEVVTLTLFRSDPPISPDDNPHVAKPLRWEAIELLNDRLKHKDDDLLSEKKKLQRKVIKNHDVASSSSVESSSSSKKNEVDSKEPSFDVLFDSTSILNSEQPGMQRCLRPKSLDVLNSSDRKQITENEDNFYRQTSVTAALINQKSKNGEAASNEESGIKKGVKTLLKWRGSSFPNENELPTVAMPRTELDYCSENSPSANMKHFVYEDFFVGNHITDVSMSTMPEQYLVQTIDITLDRGWHGRLGFTLGNPSIQENDSVIALPFAPEVRAVYPDSLAGKDGRIKVGDRLVEVNSESFLSKPAVEAIDILRKTRGIVRMVFSRL